MLIDVELTFLALIAAAAAYVGAIRWSALAMLLTVSERLQNTNSSYRPSNQKLIDREIKLKALCLRLNIVDGLLLAAGIVLIGQQLAHHVWDGDNTLSTRIAIVLFAAAFAMFAAMHVLVWINPEGSGWASFASIVIVIVVLIVLLAVFLKHKDATGARPTVYRVLHVIDGRTFVVETGSQHPLTVRVADISLHPENDERRIAASHQVRTLISGKRVRLYPLPDTLSKEAPLYAYVIFDGMNLGDELIQRGLATPN